MVDSKVLTSKYVKLNEKSYGYVIDSKAPEAVKKQFREFQEAQNAIRSIAKGRKK